MKQLPQGKVVRCMVCASLCLILSHVTDVLADIYRWQDASGTTSYGDNPPPTALHTHQLHPTAYDSYGVIAYVIDGDTVELTDHRRIRLLGINTPEIAHHGRPGQPLGLKAKQFLKTLVQGKRVMLRYDMQHRDHYQRVLAHLYLENGEDINALLLKKGLAHALFLWPNLKGAKRYYELEKKARGKRLGIWSLPAYQINPLAHLGMQRNRFTRLRGRVTRVEQRRRYDYLLFGKRLRVAIKRKRLPLFEKAGIDIKALDGHQLTLRGWLSQRHGTPYLKLEQPFQLEQIDGRSRLQ